MPSLRWAVAIAAAVAVSCGGKQQQPAQGALSSRWTAPSILASVPAESPYVFALHEPMNEALRQRMMGHLDTQLAESFKALDKLRASKGEIAPWMRAVMALGDELRGKPSTTWSEQLGLDPRGRIVLYGLSLWPV